MKHITHHADDVPVIPVVMERRRTPDRRVEWRGGRRDTDWQERPLGAWPAAEARLGRTHRLARLLSALHLC